MKLKQEVDPSLWSSLAEKFEIPEHTRDRRELLAAANTCRAAEGSKRGSAILVPSPASDLEKMGAMYNSNVDDSILKEEELRIIRSRLHLLSPQQRDIILCITEGLPDSIIMAYLDMSRSSYRSQKHNAIVSLRTGLRRVH